ncbi:MAG: hypothetical protein INQ03_24275 [Candidatus Heimdallarchaeota archaeon]|nr:hypothetical protein [Candidatus Heimdallarchaeota archaeon]
MFTKTGDILLLEVDDTGLIGKLSTFSVPKSEKIHSEEKSEEVIGDILGAADKLIAPMQKKNGTIIQSRF